MFVVSVSTNSYAAATIAKLLDWQLRAGAQSCPASRYRSFAAAPECKRLCFALNSRLRIAYLSDLVVHHVFNRDVSL